MSTIFFFLIFGWKINPILDLSVLTTLPIYFYAAARPQNLPSIITKSLLVSGILAISVIYCFIIYLGNEPSSLQWILRTIRAGLSFGAIFILVDLYSSNNSKPDDKFILRAVAVAITTHAGITILSQIYSPLRHFIYSITQAHLYVNEMTLLMDNRPLGLTYSLSVTSVLYFIAAAILVQFPTKDLSGKIIKFGSLALNTVACLWVARTGLVFFPLLGLLAFQQLQTLRPKQLVIAIGSIAIFITISWFIANLEPKQGSFLHSRLVELFTFFSSSTENRFAQQFLNMFHLPDELTQLFIGNSLTGREDGHYVASDVGYVLIIYGTGIVGQLLMLLPVLIGIYASIKVFKHKKEYALLALIVLGSYLIVNIKELALLTRTVWPVICVFISISLLEYQAQRKRQNGDETS